MKGVAHISFDSGGGVILPARNAYDRGMLVEHIAESVRSKGHLHVALDDHSWSVHRGEGPPRTLCYCCGYALHPTCYSAASGAAYCLQCAFGAQSDASTSEPRVVP